MLNSRHFPYFYLMYHSRENINGNDQFLERKIVIIYATAQVSSSLYQTSQYMTKQVTWNYVIHSAVHLDSLNHLWQLLTKIIMYKNIPLINISQIYVFFFIFISWNATIFFQHFIYKQIVLCFYAIISRNGLRIFHRCFADFHEMLN